MRPRRTDERRGGETHRGGRPGDPYADIVHSIVLTYVLDKLEARLQTEGLIIDVEWDGERSLCPPHTGGAALTSLPLFDASLADDVVLFCEAPTSEAFVPRLSHLLGEVHDAFTTIGAILNLIGSLIWTS